MEKYIWYWYSLLVGQVGGGASKVVGLNAAGQPRGILQTAAGGTVKKKYRHNIFMFLRNTKMSKLTLARSSTRSGRPWCPTSWCRCWRCWGWRWGWWRSWKTGPRRCTLEKRYTVWLGVVVNCCKLTKKQRPFFPHFLSKYFALWLELLMCSEMTTWSHACALNTILKNPRAF